MERARSYERGKPAMTRSGELRSGKGAGDENFPVASRLIARRHRPAIMAFYEFVRVADDIADHPDLGSAEKISRLNQLESSLIGRGGDDPEGTRLHEVLNARGLSPRHALDLLDAFRQDAEKRRYADWDDLIDYCSRSAMPVGRFVLDVHGEAKETWPASDALCAALQVINHLQDCGVDYRRLDRIYVPLDALAAAGTTVESLGEGVATLALKECLRGLAARTAALLQQSEGLAESVSDARLAVEISVIQSLARRLLTILAVRDPLSEKVHLTKIEALATALGGGIHAGLQRLLRTITPGRRYQVHDGT
jgi:squalene synthase HpnC